MPHTAHACPRTTRKLLLVTNSAAKSTTNQDTVALVATGTSAKYVLAASEIAAEIYGLEILARDIQTVKDNFTRFIILQKEKVQTSTLPNKASFKITIRNEAGGLAKLLTLLAEKGLNLSKIQSIPVMEKPWEYAFFIDAEFGDYGQFREAMNLVVKDFGDLKIFGEYSSRKG